MNKESSTSNTEFGQIVNRILEPTADEWLTQYLGRNAQKREKCWDEFFRIFKIPLRKYWNNLTGFDIVAFDTDIIKSGDRSPKDVLFEKFGQQACSLIEELLNTEV